MTQMTPEQVFTIAVIGGATVGAILLLTAALALSLYLGLPRLHLTLGTWRAARTHDRYETADTDSDDQDVRDWFAGTRRAIEALPTTDHPTDD